MLHFHQLSLIIFIINIISTEALDFLFNSFNTTDLTLIGDARLESSRIRLTNDSNQFSIGRAFYPSTIPIQLNNPTNLSSFSTSFVFSILPQVSNSPGFGLAFVLSNSTSPPGAISGQYFGLFSNSTIQSNYPLLAIEFDTGQNPEFNDPNDNHVGIDLNNIESQVYQSAGYYNSSNGVFVPVNMKNGQNIRAWIEFDGTQFEINVTIAPLSVSKPLRPLINFRNPVIANYVSSEMFVGFSGSKVTWVEPQRVLAWSLSNNGIARDINTTNLPVFLPESSSSSKLSAGVIAAITISCIVGTLVCLFCVYWFWWRKWRNEDEEEDKIEDWELEYWPHRFSYEELFEATKGFSKDELLGSGGFGKVYKGVLSKNTEVGVKCVAHDSKQGLREFMAEISSMGRLQHKNLVQLRGWCRKGNELLLVYDYMPNGSLNRWIFEKPKQLLNWDGRRRVLVDVAEGLSYLHHGWEQVVLHRDIKSSNILLDSDMRGRLGDFGLAKLYQHGQAPGTTRVVGTLGYLAPELANVPAPTAASDVYSFGVVVMEVVCGRRPIETWSDDEPLLIDWVRELYEEGKLREAADERMYGEYKVEDVEIILKLGLACCHPDPQHRPTMKEVVAILIGEEAEVAAKPASLLSELGRGNSGEEGAPLHPPYGDVGILKADGLV
ncbi:L-type lectin-domain containing receptor kinase S.1 [Thalictrum thalictroides]|uniref:non-specific serine/threonine protein kinase n=1 Tax=Thalictrum thalictroides TaxID=46969 RepID=A0A7J6VQC3_THATH|nr:L-type lectin-domain containing receptor kinase S.1 [Thalictrum thalictroides]